MRSFSAKLLLALLAVVLTLGCFEIAFRALDYRGFHNARARDWPNRRTPPEHRVPGLPIKYRPGFEFRFVYDGDPRGYFDPDATLTFRGNKHGHRGPDFSARKPEGVYRIVVLGDSFTFGEGVRLEHIFTTRLGEALGERVGEQVEVINAGTGSWGTAEEVRYLEQRVLGWDPDLVVLVFVPNDANYAAGLDIFDDFREVYEPPPGWLRRSWVLSFAYSRIRRELAGRHYIDELAALSAGPDKSIRRKWKRAFDQLGEAASRVRASQARFAIVMFPFMYRLDDSYPLRTIHERVEARAAELEVPYLDLLPAFAGERYSDLWVHPSDQHPNENAHAIAASAIADFLISEDLLTEPESSR